MKGQIKVVLIVVVVLAVAAGGYYFLKGGGGGSASSGTVSSGAQSSGGQAGGPGGGGGGRGSQFREEHKWTFQLTRLVRNISRLDSDKKFPLAASQAKSVLGVLNPLRKQKTMDQEQAKTAIRQLQDILTEDQRTAISTMAPEHQFRREAGPGGGPPQSRRPTMDPKAMENFNPFNPPKDSPMAQRGAERMNQLFKGLEARAKGK